MSEDNKFESDRTDLFVEESPNVGLTLQSGSEQQLNRYDLAVKLADRQAIVLSATAELLGAQDLEHSLDAFTGFVQKTFDAERVTVAVCNSEGELELSAISQQAIIDKESSESRLLLDVCNECLDYERIVCFPDNGELGILAAHREFGSRHAGKSLTSIPMYNYSEPVAVMLIERLNKKELDVDALKLLEQVSLIAAPCLTLRIDAESSPWRRCQSVLSATREKYFGSHRYAAKLLLSAFCLLIALACLVPLPQHISAEAELVPLERRLITAPFDGFVERIMVGAGESVDEGAILARLEPYELELEGSRRDGEVARAEAEFRSAMASYDRQATAIARAKLEKERVSRALVDQRLERISIRAPISGLIVSGDPTDAVGAPITRGEVLFEIAQADDYEVHLMVHERNIRDVTVGQRGTLRLRARPGDELALKVNAIHPVAESANGASRFRVRATLEVPSSMLPRPGESGVAQLESEPEGLAQSVMKPVIQHLAELWWRFSV